MLLQLCSRGMWADGDGVTDNSGSNSAVPADDSLSAGLHATVDYVSLLELLFTIYCL